MTDIFGIAKRLLITCNDRIVLLFFPVKLSTLKIVDKLRKQKIAWKYKHVSTIEIYTCFNSIFVTNIIPTSLIRIYVKSFDTLSGTLTSNSNIKNMLRQRDLLFIYDYNKHYICTRTLWNKRNWTDQRNIILSNDSYSKKRSWEFV